MTLALTQNELIVAVTEYLDRRGLLTEGVAVKFRITVGQSHYGEWNGASVSAEVSELDPPAKGGPYR